MKQNRQPISELQAFAESALAAESPLSERPQKWDDSSAPNRAPVAADGLMASNAARRAKTEHDDANAVAASSNKAIRTQPPLCQSP